MARIENTVFISYRRADVYTALAVYENLKNQGYDVFFDYRSISSGDFEQIITSNIRARAHFLLILTPTALDRLNEPGDWLRREIETAIDDKRNIIPLFFKGFRFGGTSVSDTLTGKLRNLSRYNGLNVHEDYFDEAMHRLRTQFLNIPLDTVLHPVSTEVQRVVRAEQVAADKALEQIEDVKELVKQGEENPVQLPEPDPMPVLKPSELVATSPEKVSGIKPSPKKTESGSEASQSLSKQKIPALNLNFRLLGGIAGGVLLLALLIWGGTNIFQDTPATPSTPTRSTQVVATQTSRLVATNTPSPTQIPASPTSELGIGSTMTGKDGMTLLYVPAGDFIMGSADDNGQPVHSVYLDAFWIDQTEITNAMYAQCVQNSNCNEPKYDHMFNNSNYANHPVVYVSWNDAQAYCSWADRRLPTEAEWEKSASWNATSQTKYVYPWGNEAPHNNLLNYKHAIIYTAEVTRYPDGVSPYGAFDMAGNVWEWVSDWYDENYYATLKENARNPLGPVSGLYRVLRGGAWSVEGDYFVRSTYRYWSGPMNTVNSVGFRCAISASAVIEPAPSVLPTNSATSSATSSLGIGSTMTGKDGMTLVYVPAGEFTMGSDYGGSDERPVHKVVLEAFWIDQTEITNAMYAKCVEGGNCEHGAGTHISQKHSEYYGNSAFDSYPVIYVSWDDANAYCQWAGRRLPTEAEWEKAARGNDGRNYPWGTDWPNPGSDLLNHYNSVGDTTEVGKYPKGASPYGALDMSGNVSEWVADWYDATYYSRSPLSNPLGPSSGSYHILRGASWRSEDALSWRRESYSSVAPPRNFIGFRCAMSATP